MLKRTFDIALSAAGLVLSSPLWLLFAALVKLEDGGPVFYRQERVGQWGRIFTALKFRSMRPDASAAPAPVVPGASDPRITRVGRLMRATAMDELPQLWNILRGDMSFVGPRALMPGEIEKGADGRVVPLHEIPGYATRITVRPGLTGVAQIYAARDIPRRHKFRYDRIYIAKRSWLLDVRLILLSFWISLLGTWEARGRKY
jgi:lipopolysaccharide/colanic/teichoic acid biosynthesis glycosyltransferase